MEKFETNHRFSDSENWPDLIERAHNGEAGPLMSHVQALLKRLMLSLGIAAPLHDDLSQDVALRIFEKLSQLQNPESFPAWVRSMLRNIYINATVRGKQMVTLGDSFVLDATPSRGADQFNVWETKEDLGNALKKLKAIYRGVISAHYFEGKSIEKIASEEKIPIGTVKRRLNEARRKLRKILGGSTPDPQSARHQGDLPHAAPRVHRSQTA